MRWLRGLSTRAQITTTSFVNVYHWGDFRGDPIELMERCFDAFVYVTNWGYRQFMVRLPRDSFVRHDHLLVVLPVTVRTAAATGRTRQGLSLGNAGFRRGHRRLPCRRRRIRPRRRPLGMAGFPGATRATQWTSCHTTGRWLKTPSENSTTLAEFGSFWRGARDRPAMRGSGGLRGAWAGQLPAHAPPQARKIGDPATSSPRLTSSPAMP